MKVTYICTKNSSVLGFIEGKRYIVDNNSDEEKQLANIPEFFERVFSPDEIWNVGDKVSLSGYFQNKSHPNKNGKFSLGEKLDRVQATIKEINFNTSNRLVGNIVFQAANGISYVIHNISLLKESSKEYEKTSGTNRAYKILPLETYWFINSSGIICEAIVGKIPDADRWRRMCNNYFSTYKEAKNFYENTITTYFNTQYKK